MGAIARGRRGGVDFADWQKLQHWLEDGPCTAEVPYAATLADKIPPIAVRLRRDFGTVLALVRAHALLHRGTRDVATARSWRRWTTTPPCASSWPG